MKFFSTENGCVIGSAEIDYLDFERGRVAVIDSVFIQEAYRGQGKGSALIKDCIQWATEQGCDVVELTVNAQNVEAIKLYKSLGFYDRGNNAMRFAINPSWSHQKKSQKAVKC